MFIDEETEIRKNVLQWYPIKEDSSVLQIGIDSLELAKELCNKAKEVTIIVNDDKQKEKIIQEVKCDNLEIKLVSNLENLNTEKQYDYVSLIGTIKTYQNILEEKAYKRLEKLIKIAKNNCKDDGKILLAVDNKYGMKFWTTMYAQKNILCNQNFALSKTMIDKILEEAGLTNYKYYYMLPDYKMANVIFTDDFLPNTESIHRDFTYGEEEFANFNEVEAYGEILKENRNLFKLYSNSNFIEIGKNNLEENNIMFVSYTNIRKEKYRIQTTIYKDRVEKTYTNKTSKEHIDDIKRNIDIMNKLNIKTLDSYEEDKIISKYVENEKNYDKILMEYLEKGENEKFFSKIEEYKKGLLQVLKSVNYSSIKDDNIFTKYGIKCEENILKELNFVKYGLWDLIFQNAFYIDNDLYFYDQEWYDENLPVEYIIYRAIAYFPNAHSYIPTNKLYKTLNIDKYINIFQELDNKIQEEIRDNKMWECHNRTKTGQTLIDLYSNLNNEFNEYKKICEHLDLRKLNEENEELKRENEKLNNTINSLKSSNELMLNSASWKITKPLRWLRKKIK